MASVAGSVSCRGSLSKDKRLDLTDNKRANWGFYVGISMGQLRKQWDFAFDINYQIVSAQAIPDFDISGISMGNADRSGFYTQKISPLEGGGPPLVKSLLAPQIIEDFSLFWMYY